MAERDGRELAAAAQAALLDDPEFLRGLVQGAVQAILEAEMEAHLGAGRYERSAGRTGYRNGSKPRTLHTRVGTLELRGAAGPGRARSRPRCSRATSAPSRRWW